MVAARGTRTAHDIICSRCSDFKVAGRSTRPRRSWQTNQTLCGDFSRGSCRRLYLLVRRFDSIPRRAVRLSSVRLCGVEPNRRHIYLLTNNRVIYYTRVQVGIGRERARGTSPPHLHSTRARVARKLKSYFTIIYIIRRHR